jgi:hypothetical protein
LNVYCSSKILLSDLAQGGRRGAGRRTSEPTQADTVRPLANHKRPQFRSLL